MLKIFICEDNNNFRKNVERIINNIIIIENYDMEIEISSHNPYEILERVEESNSTGLYFLDVDLNCKINGIQLAEKIRELDTRAFIIFVTTHAELSYLTFVYKVEAMDYIIKDTVEDLHYRINECIKQSLKRYIGNRGDDKVFTIKSNDKIISINYKDIMFFETSETIHKVRVHSINRRVEFYSKMKELEKSLEEEFIRCHNSYIVNRNNIKEIDVPNKILKMKNGEECLISSRGMKLLKNK